MIAVSIRAVGRTKGGMAEHTVPPRRQTGWYRVEARSRRCFQKTKGHARTVGGGWVSCQRLPDRLAGYLFLPQGVRFNTVFDSSEPPDVLERAPLPAPFRAEFTELLGRTLIELERRAVAALA